MSVVTGDYRRKIAIKGARAIVPGYGAEGSRFGSLVPSRDIVSALRPRRKPRSGRGPQPAEDLPASWLQSLLGFESIATTHVTRAAADDMVASGLEWTAAAKARRVPVFNGDVDAMTARAIAGALQQYDEGRCKPVDRARSIRGHVHVSATSSVRTPYALLDARRATGCHKPGMPIWNLLSGCSGLLFALQQARFLLQEEEAGRDEDARSSSSAATTTSCRSFTLPRARCPADRDVENIDDWLFQAIFGEGAGAIVVGHADRGRRRPGHRGHGVVRGRRRLARADVQRRRIAAHDRACARGGSDISRTRTGRRPSRPSSAGHALVSEPASPLRSRVEPEARRAHRVPARGSRRHRAQHQRQSRNPRGGLRVLAPRRGARSASRRERPGSRRHRVRAHRRGR